MSLISLDNRVDHYRRHHHQRWMWWWYYWQNVPQPLVDNNLTNQQSSTTGSSSSSSSSSTTLKNHHHPRVTTINNKFNNFSSKFSLLLLQFVLFFCLFKDTESVRLVALNVPSHVRQGTEVELQCLYDLGNATLYSLKWFYRANHTDLDEQEFFRYTPTLKPNKQYFPLDGVKVNLNKSEGGRLVIVETNGKTSGMYKCEISLESTFHTVAAEKLMTVHDFWNFYLPDSIKSHLGSGGTSATTSATTLFIILLTLCISLYFTTTPITATISTTNFNSNSNSNSNSTNSTSPTTSITTTYSDHGWMSWDDGDPQQQQHQNNATTNSTSDHHSSRSLLVQNYLNHFSGSKCPQSISLWLFALSTYCVHVCIHFCFKFFLPHVPSPYIRDPIFQTLKNLLRIIFR